MDLTKKLVIILFLLGGIGIPATMGYQASCYGSLYGPTEDGGPQIDTSQAATSACNSLNQMGYVSTAYTNPGPGSTLVAFNRLKSDNVFVFEGHGGPGEIAFAEGQSSPGVWRIYDNYAASLDSPVGHYHRISDYGGGELDNMLLAVLVSCHSAESSSNEGNLLDELTYRGVDTAIGFTGTIIFPQSEEWSTKFFQYQQQGYNYNDSARMAANDVINDNGGQNFGLTNYRIRGSVTNLVIPARNGYSTIMKFPVTVTAGQDGQIDPITDTIISGGQSRTLYIQGGSEKKILIQFNSSHQIGSVTFNGTSLTGTLVTNYVQGLTTYQYSIPAIWESGHTLTATFIPITQPPTAPVADFGATITSGTAPLATTFVDYTTNHPTSWTWTFGDGTPQLIETGTSSGPSHTYLQPGTYTVTLTTTNAGGSSTKTRTGYITVTAAPPNERVTNGNMNSVDGWTTTNGGAGSGGTTAVTPYSYNGQTGGYLELDAFGDPGGTGNPGWANAQISQTVNLTNVRNLTFYLRSIGGSKPSSSSQHLDVWLDNNHLIDSINPLGYSPSWTQSTFNVSGLSPGNHTIKFFTSTTNGGNIAIGVDTVSALVEVIAPVAFFNASPISGTVPLTVTFNDTSQNKPTTWAWDFGDGTSSTSKNVTHIYNLCANFTVKLTVANTAGSSNATKTITVRTLSILPNFTATPRTGSAPLSVTFTDTSTGSPTGWAWFFGDENFTTPWTQVNASAGWSARLGHSSVVMPDGSIVLTGGWDGSCKNDVWRSTNNGVTWTRVNASAGWSARAYHSSVALPDGSIVLMGGYDSTGEKNDVWRSANNGVTWTRMTANASWSARSDHCSVAMPDGSIVLMGGWYISSGMNDVWRSTDKGATWVRMNASAGWSTRADQSSVAMPDGSIVLTGGADNNGFKNDTWRSTNSGATWTRMNASAGWSARAYHSSVAMPDGSIVLMGGYNTGTTGASKTDSGQSVRDHRRIMAISGDSPAPMAVSDSSGGVGEEKNDVWRSTNNGTTWVRVSASAGWTPRDSFSSTAMPDGSIVLMGGGDNDVYNNNVWQLMPAGSSARNPVHIYTLPGLYKVSLQVNNAAGYNSTRKTGYVNVTQVNDGIALFRNSTGYWYFDSNLDGISEKSFRYGNNGDRIIKGDWLGTGKDGIANVSSSTGNWSFDYNLDGVVDKSFRYGNSLDKIVAGDWNGTGRDGIAIFRPSTGYWYFDNNLDGIVDWNFRFGGNPYNDTPVVGDWNSTGRDGIAIFRNETGFWYFDKNLDSVIDYSFRFGGSPNYDQVSVGNWNGTGKDGIAIFRQSTGYWYFDYNLDSVIDKSFRFGSINDRIFTGDWTGSGKDGIALFRPSTGYWYFDNNLDGVVDKSFRYGNSTDQIIAGKWV